MLDCVESILGAVWSVDQRQECLEVKMESTATFDEVEKKVGQRNRLTAGPIAISVSLVQGSTWGSSYRNYQPITGSRTDFVLENYPQPAYRDVPNT